MKILMNVDIDTALEEGKDTYGRQIIDIPVASISPGYRKLLIASDDEDADLELVRYFDAAENRWGNRGVRVSPCPVGEATRGALLAQLGSLAEQAEELRNKRLERIREIVQHDKAVLAEQKTRVLKSGERVPDWSDLSLMSDETRAVRDSDEARAWAKRLRDEHTEYERERVAEQEQERAKAENERGEALHRAVLQYGTPLQQRKWKSGYMARSEVIDLIIEAEVGKPARNAGFIGVRDEHAVEYDRPVTKILDENFERLELLNSRLPDLPMLEIDAAIYTRDQDEEEILVFEISWQHEMLDLAYEVFSRIGSVPTQEDDHE